MATSNYPGSLDDYSTLPSSGTPITVSSHYFGPAITNIEAELGTDPAGYATDLKTRLSDINPSEGNLNLDAGYGSKAPIYGVRAWVNFDGTGTVAIRGSGNVSSITDNGTGLYTVNFTSAMPDVNYAAVTNPRDVTGGVNVVSSLTYGHAVGSVDVQTAYSGASSKTLYDANCINVVVAR